MNQIGKSFAVNAVAVIGLCAGAALWNRYGEKAIDKIEEGVTTLHNTIKNRKEKQA